MNVEFVSYDGKYPNLCAGTLVVSVDGVQKEFKCCLSSGGSVWFDKDYNEHVESGAWTFNPDESMSEELRLAIQEVVNDNIPYGCCGGCI